MTEQKVDALKLQLFSGNPPMVFAILDGASVPGLPAALKRLKPEHNCLYRGELQMDLAEVAPYLAILKRSALFTDWVLSEGWGRHWGIFGTANVDLPTLTTHFRKFMLVCDEKNSTRYFRYYDPRVWRAFLPACGQEQQQTFFGPVTSYFAEDEETKRGRKYTLIGNRLCEECFDAS